MKRIKTGTHIVIQRGRYAGYGGNVISYEREHRYAIKLSHYKVERKVIAPRKIFLTSNELIGPLVRKVRNRWPSQ